MNTDLIRSQLLRIIRDLDESWAPAQLAMHLGAIVTEHTGYNTGGGGDYASLIPEGVLCAVVAEMAYQSRKWGAEHIRQQSVEGHLLVLEEELLEARKGWAKNLAGRNSVQSEITQVVATGIQALINLHNRAEADLESKASL